MKKIAVPFILFLTIVFVSCNNKDKKADSDHTGKIPGTEADSLMAEVMDGHNFGMARMSKISVMQKEVQRVLDSIAALPAKARQASVPLKTKLDSAAADLSYAEMAMNKWMEEFNMDSAINNMQERIKYLTNEKSKVGKVKEAILKGLQKADSLLKAKL